MALAALGGPVALGAIVGLEVGPLSALTKSLALPAVLAGVAAVMVPAPWAASSLGCALRGRALTWFTASTSFS
jgi:hypothetical protein